MRVAKPRAFVARFVQSPRGQRWEIRQGKRWRAAKEISFLTPTLTQPPDGQLLGSGVVR